MTNDISYDNKSKIYDELKIIVFDKIRKTIQENRIMRIYKVNLFNNI